MAKALTSMKIDDLNTGLISHLHSVRSNGFQSLIFCEGENYGIDATSTKTIPRSKKCLIALTDGNSQRSEFNSEFKEAVRTAIKEKATFYAKGREGANPGSLFKWTVKQVKKSKAARKKEKKALLQRAELRELAMLVFCGTTDIRKPRGH
jgi:hypothetical protein